MRVVLGHTAPSRAYLTPFVPPQAGKHPRWWIFRGLTKVPDSNTANNAFPRVRSCSSWPSKQTVGEAGNVLRCLLQSQGSVEEFLWHTKDFAGSLLSYTLCSLIWRPCKIRQNCLVEDAPFLEVTRPYVSSGLRLTCNPLIPSVSNRKALSINLFTPGSKPVWSVIEPFHRWENWGRGVLNGFGTVLDDIARIRAQLFWVLCQQWFHQLAPPTALEQKPQKPASSVSALRVAAS